MKRMIALLPATLLLSGCLGDLIELGCMLSDDADHCYQAAAVQNSDPEDCENVKGEGFTGTNPPRDKCLLQIGGNTGDMSACDRMEGGFMSYSPEECRADVLRDHSPEDCAQAADPAACRNAWARQGKGCGDGFDLKDGACIEHTEAPEPEKKPLNANAVNDLRTMRDAAAGQYMDLLKADIESETDPGRLAGLQAYQTFLEQSGSAMESVETTMETLEKLKEIFVDTYDPSMDIQHMNVDDIIGPGVLDQISERIFGPEKKEGLERENSDADDALRVYEAMLKQQEKVDFVKKDKLERLGDTIVSELKDKAQSAVVDPAKEIAEGIAGTAFIAVNQVGEALQAFQDEAQHQMFLGLARAYNRRREALQAENPGLSAEELHARTVQQVKDDPYQDNTQLAVVKHGNLIENGECDGSNPLCIQSDVWWTALEKTYRYTH